MLDLQHLRSFLMVAAELHFGRAARRLHMTQPPLSRQIQLLERELGVPLFVRASRSVSLTEAGRAFLPEARALLQRSEQAVQVARHAAEAPGGALAVGFVGAATYGFLPRLARRARAELPGVTLTFLEMTSAAQLEALALNRIDLGLGRPVPEQDGGRDAGLRTACVGREALALALPDGHPLTRLRRPAPRQLHGEDFIMYSRDGRYMHDMLSAAFEAAVIQPRVVQRLANAQAILSLVSIGMGAAIVPEEARNACFGSVAFRPIRLGRDLHAELHAAWLSGNRNPALPALRVLLGLPQ